MSDQLIKLYIDTHPAFLLTEVHVTLVDLSDHANKPYDQFIDTIINISNNSDELNNLLNILADKEDIEYLTERGLYKIVDEFAVEPDKLTFDLKKEYFDEKLKFHELSFVTTICRKDSEDSELSSTSSSGEYEENQYEREKIVYIKNFNTNGELLYSLAQSLPKRISNIGMDDNEISFDGLCYYQGKYIIMEYMYQLTVEAIYD